MISDEVIEDAPDISMPPNSQLFDRFGQIAGCNMKARLDNFAIQLQSQPGTMGYLATYSIPTSGRNYGQMLAERAIEYLVNDRGIERRRLVTVIGGPRKELTTQLWIVLPAD